jgi:hypothetical protein
MRKLKAYCQKRMYYMNDMDEARLIEVRYEA